MSEVTILFRDERVSHTGLDAGHRPVSHKFCAPSNWTRARMTDPFLGRLVSREDWVVGGIDDHEGVDEAAAKEDRPGLDGSRQVRVPAGEYFPR